MSNRFTSFIKSKQFIFSMIAAALIVFRLTFGSLKYVKVYKQYGKEIKVPDLKELKIEDARNQIGEGFEIVMIDTIHYKPRIAPLTISQPSPHAGYAVTQGS